jgi:hypothetical protein
VDGPGVTLLLGDDVGGGAHGILSSGFCFGIYPLPLTTNVLIFDLLSTLFQHYISFSFSTNPYSIKPKLN